MSKELRYKPLIDLGPEEMPPEPGDPLLSPDRRDGQVYVFNDELRLAAEVALVTARPLLLRGKPGTGKSSFAAYLARRLKWRYYEYVCTARMQAQEILWKFDAVRRLGDAQVRRAEDPPLNDHDYVEPGVLWWVLDRDSALRRGSPQRAPASKRAVEPFGEINQDRSPDHAIILLDEIDKADPDVPNNLLVPLGSLQFRVEETGTVVQSRRVDGSDGFAGRLLVVLTTNEERDLPQAFLRRCVVHWLEEPDQDLLLTIAKSHFKQPDTPLKPQELRLFRAIAAKVVQLREQAVQLGLRPPSTAEYLDAVRACRALGIQATSRSPVWNRLEQAVLSKREEEKRGK